MKFSRIEKETRTRITIPRVGADEKEDIIVTGDTKSVKARPQKDRQTFKSNED
jgi:hypothetical protein